MELAEAAQALRKFGGSDLTITLENIEAAMRGVKYENCAKVIAATGAHQETLSAAATLKVVVGQINVVIHALGILLCLPHILEPGETIEYVSLGAGNTGRSYDLETSSRIAEFKFIQWQGGPESIRQNSLFKDFFLLAESASSKRKYLYVVGTDHPLKFFNGGRALASVLSKDNRVKTRFEAKFDGKYKTVRDYYADFKDVVHVEDVSKYVAVLVPRPESLDEEDE